MPKYGFSDDDWQRAKDQAREILGRVAVNPDYLYPSDYFVFLELPEKAKRAWALTRLRSGRRRSSANPALRAPRTTGRSRAAIVGVAASGARVKAALSAKAGF